VCQSKPAAHSTYPPTPPPGPRAVQPVVASAGRHAALQGPTSQHCSWVYTCAQTPTQGYRKPHTHTNSHTQCQRILTHTHHARNTRVSPNHKEHPLHTTNVPCQTLSHAGVVGAGRHPCSAAHNKDCEPSAVAPTTRSEGRLNKRNARHGGQRAPPSLPSTSKPQTASRLCVTQGALPSAPAAAGC
jgi:hypothetical protein